MVEWSEAHVCVRRPLGYWGFDPRFRVGLESGWNCVSVFSYTSTFQSQVGNTQGGLGQAKPEALALVRLRFVRPNVQ